MRLTEPRFMVLKIAINVIHCVSHTAEFSTGMIYVLLQHRRLELDGMG